MEHVASHYKMGGVKKLIYYSNPIARLLFKIYCILSNAEIPPNVKIGRGLNLPHGLKGFVLHPKTVIEEDVTIFHQVTCGRGDLYNIWPNITSSPFKGIVLKKGCVLCVGAKVICNRGTLVVGENTVIAANAVLTKSTGDNEVWAGIPARCIKKIK